MADVVSSFADRIAKTETSISEVPLLIDAKLDKFLAAKISGEFETHAQGHGRDEKLADLSDRVKEIEKKLAQLIAFGEQGVRGANERIDWLGQAFAAVGNLDWHKDFHPKLVADGDELCRLVDNLITDETWNEWVNLEKRWRGELSKWLIVVEYYAPNAAESVDEIKDDVYYSESWAFDEAVFGKADRVKRYKELAIAVANLKSAKGDAERGMKYFAFVGAGKRGRQDSPPSLGGDR